MQSDAAGGKSPTHREGGDDAWLGTLNAQVKAAGAGDVMQCGRCCKRRELGQPDQ